MINETGNLPGGWTIEPIGNLCDANPKHSKELSDELEISFVPMASVDDVTGTIQKHETRKLGKVRRGYTHFAETDVIFAKITPCMENGKSAIAEDLKNGLACGSTEFHVLRSQGGVLSEYLHPFLRQISYRNIAAQSMTGAVGHRRVPKQYLLDTELPLPPLNEQHRIVKKIESLTTRSRKAREALSAIPPLLDQFRQSVLAAAFRGDLTADWRAENLDVESGEVLLGRIREDRRAKWEKTEFEKMNARGKLPKNDKWKQKYKVFSVEDTSSFPQIPSSWSWIVVEELVSDIPRSLQSGPFGSNLKHSEFQDSGILAIGIDNVLPGEFSLGKQNRISTEKYKELEKYTARPLDVLITVMATVGRCCVVPQDIETAIITKHVYRASPEQSLIDSYFLMNALRGSSVVLSQIDNNIRGQTRPGINGQVLRKLVLPVPPKAEQQAILEAIEEQMGGIASLDLTIENLDTFLSQLDQSILSKAFRGDLVPQDPTDEPATILLNRIRTEREKSQTAKKKTKRKKKS